jgi:hypothetical protein
MTLQKLRLFIHVYAVLPFVINDRNQFGWYTSMCYTKSYRFRNVPNWWRSLDHVP